MTNLLPEHNINQLAKDIATLIAEAKEKATATINSALVLLNWHIGSKINEEIGSSKRAEYGKQVVSQLANKLTVEYGRGFTRTNLFRMIQFHNLFPDVQIVVTLSRQLSWSHFVEILAIKDPLKTQFYCEMCRCERWSVRELREKIQGMLYERTALSKNTENFIRSELQKIEIDSKPSLATVFKDPYMLDFLNLPQDFTEQTLEKAILIEMSAFISELGNDFCFIERQKRITIGEEDYYIDLLFFHRGLRRLIVIELKLGRFTASHKGQMELYLRWLDKYERKENEESPLGIILCAEKNQEQVELLRMDQSGIHVAEYLTQLPPKELLQRKLHTAITIAREKIEHKDLNKNRKNET